MASCEHYTCQRPVPESAFLAPRPPPEAHRPRLDLRGRSDIESLVEETGRPYHTLRYWTEMADQDFDVRPKP